MRRAGLVVVLGAGILAVVTTALPWVDFGGFDLTLFDITNLEAVIAAALGFVAIAFAALALARGGRVVQASLAAAVLAGVVGRLAQDAYETADQLLGLGPAAARVAAGVALVGALLLAVAPDDRRMLRVAAALAAVVAGWVIAANALEVHPEIEIIR
jgi:hypothetical protein